MVKRVNTIHAGVFLDGQEDVLFSDILDSLDSFYRIIGCNTIDITQCAGIDVICDDEGLLKDSTPSLFILDDSGKVSGCLVGGLVFAGHDKDGNTVSLNEEQKRFLGQLETLRYWDKDGKIHTALMIPEDLYRTPL